MHGFQCHNHQRWSDPSWNCLFMAFVTSPKQKWGKTVSSENMVSPNNWSLTVLHNLYLGISRRHRMSKKSADSSDYLKRGFYSRTDILKKSFCFVLFFNLLLHRWTYDFPPKTLVAIRFSATQLNLTFKIVRMKGLTYGDKTIPVSYNFIKNIANQINPLTESFISF